MHACFDHKRAFDGIVPMVRKTREEIGAMQTKIHRPNDLAASINQAMARDTVQDLTTQLAVNAQRAMDAKRSEIITEVINARLGTDWTLLELVGRCQVRIYPDKREVFTLDGVELVEFMPVQREMVGTEMRFDQPYRLLVEEGCSDEHRKPVTST